MPLSKSQKAVAFELAASGLTLFLSGGNLRLAQPSVDEDDVDRVLTRRRGGAVAFLQMKCRQSPLARDILDLRFAPVADAASRDDLFLVGGELARDSPFVGPRFALVPAPKLPPPNRSGQVVTSIPLRRGSKSRWAPFVHDREEVATALSRALDGGAAYPFPPPGGPARLAAALSPRALGYLLETQTAVAALVHGEGRLDLWTPLVDDFGEDLSFTDRGRAASVRVQPKGSVGLNRNGQLAAKVRRATFRPTTFDYLVFVNFDPAALALTPWAFVIRADEFAARATAHGEFLRFQARPDPSAGGPWSPWLYRVSEIAGVFETALAARRAWGAGARLPAEREDVVKVRRELARTVRWRGSARRPSEPR